MRTKASSPWRWSSITSSRSSTAPLAPQGDRDPVGDAEHDRVDPLVGGDERAAGAESVRDADRGVAGERAELERAPGADRAAQKREERALLGGDLHHRPLASELLRLHDEPREEGVGRAGVGDEVAVE